MACKRRLRADLRRQPVPRGEAAGACGAAAARHLAASADLSRARRVALFASLPGELPTRPVFALLGRLGRTALFPRVRVGEALEFAPLARWEELRRTALGLWEPPAILPAVPLGPQDLVLVPGLGFDRHGGRLGRGGGLYDRTFPPGAPAPALVALAFACQVVDRLPAGPHDRRIDAIVTEYGMIRVSGG